MKTRIAHAIAKAVGEDDPLDPKFLRESFYGDAADAVLEAMREPTEAMLAEAISSPEALIPERVLAGDAGYRQRMNRATAAERLALAGHWRAMIDAALGEGKAKEE